MSANSDFKDLLRTLADFDVKYLIVGGYAVMHYCEPRYTKDIDIWIEASTENGTKIFSALKTFGAPLTGMSPRDFSEEGYFYKMGDPPVRIDILMSLTGVSFADSWKRKTIGDFDGTEAFFISKEDLITTKLASARPQISSMQSCFSWPNEQLFREHLVFS